MDQLFLQGRPSLLGLLSALSYIEVKQSMGFAWHICECIKDDILRVMGEELGWA